MKTRNKTNRRFIGIAVLMMVLNLVNFNLKAQNSYNQYNLADLSSTLFLNIKYEINQAISETKTFYNTIVENPLEDWMMNPSDWKNNNTSEIEADFEENEMIIEDWMINPTEWKSVETTAADKFEGDEMILEDWMMKANWEDNSLLEEELQIEDWMTSPATWTSLK